MTIMAEITIIIGVIMTMVKFLTMREAEKGDLMRMEETNSKITRGNSMIKEESMTIIIIISQIITIITITIIRGIRMLATIPMRMIEIIKKKILNSNPKDSMIKAIKIKILTIMKEEITSVRMARIRIKVIIKEEISTAIVSVTQLIKSKTLVLQVDLKGMMTELCLV